MHILGVRVDEVSLAEAVERASQAVEYRAERPFLIVTPNPEQVMLAQEDEEFRRVLERADLAIADGVGLVWASRRLAAARPLRQRVSGVELMERLVEVAAGRGWRVLLVGGREEMAAKAAAKLRSDMLKLKVLGVAGFKDVRRPEAAEQTVLLATIRKFRPTLVFVGFGAPAQEKWAAGQLKALGRAGVRLVMVVGGALDQLANPTLRPPRRLEAWGLGWLYRLVRQPWRIRRQKRLVQFALRILNGES